MGERVDYTKAGDAASQWPLSDWLNEQVVTENQQENRSAYFLHLENKNSFFFDVSVLDGQIQTWEWYKIWAALWFDTHQSQSLLAEGESFSTRNRSTQTSNEAGFPADCFALLETCHDASQQLNFSLVYVIL